MGLRVEKNLDVFNGKSLVGFRFDHGNEYTLDLEDKEGKIERVRISASLKELLDDYKAMG